MTLPVLIVLCISCNTMADGADATRDAPAEDRTTKTVASCLEKIMAVPWPTRGSKVEEVWEDFTGQIELAFWQGFVDDPKRGNPCRCCLPACARVAVDLEIRYEGNVWDTIGQETWEYTVCADGTWEWPKSNVP